MVSMDLCFEDHVSFLVGVSWVLCSTDRGEYNWRAAAEMQGGGYLEKACPPRRRREIPARLWTPRDLYHPAPARAVGSGPSSCRPRPAEQGTLRHRTQLDGSRVRQTRTARVAVEGSMVEPLKSREVQESQSLRPVEMARHMAGVAELIQGIFGATLDDPGRRMLKEMRSLGRLGWLGWLAAKMLLPPAAHPGGFVWVRENRVVGNASLMPVEGCPERWVLANVAVYPDDRRKGIGRALVEACVDKARDLKSRLLILQVKPSNSEARELYEKLGFSVMTTRTTWIRHKARVPVDLSDASDVRERRAGEWMDQWGMAQRMHPEGLIWPFPLQRDLFQPPRGAGNMPGEAPRHWVWGVEDRVQASLTAKRALERAGWRLLLLVEPQARGKAELPLLTAALTNLRAGQVTLLLDYPSGLAETELHDCGFTVHNSLSWMFLSLDGG